MFFLAAVVIGYREISRFKAFQLFQEVPGIQCFFGGELACIEVTISSFEPLFAGCFQLHEFAFPSLVGYMHKAGSNSRHTVQITSRQTTFV